MMCGMVSDAEKRRVGALIRTRRQQLGWRQPALAARIGISRNAVSNVETGRTYPVRWLGKAEAVLGISLTEPAPDPQVQEIRELATRLGLTTAQQDDWVAVYRRRQDSPPGEQRAG